MSLRRAWALVAVVWAGCSLLPLGDHPLECEPQPLRAGQSRDEYDDPCAALNELHGLRFDRDCFVYQCRADGRGCELRAQDLDDDGAIDAQTCEGSEGADAAASYDCDDAHPARGPGQSERCDGIDNDCNGLVDDGLEWRADLWQEFEPALDARGSVQHVGVAAVDAERLFVTVTRALDEPGDGVTSQTQGLVYRGGQREGSELLASFSDAEDNPSCAGDFECTLTALGVARGGEGLVFAARNLLGCGSGELLLRAGVASEPLALADAPGRFVRPDAAPCGTGLPRVAAREAAGSRLADALVAFRAVESGDVMLLGAGVEGGPALRVAPDPLVLGQGRDAMALAPWQPTPSTGGYLVAYASRGNCDGLRAALVQPLEERDEFEVTAKCLLEEADVEHVALSAGSGDDPETPEGAAVAWRRAGRVFLAPLGLTSDGRPKLAAEPLQLSTSDDVVDGPELVYLPRGFRVPSEKDTGGGWFVVWTAGSALMGVRVSARGLDTVDPPQPLFRSEGARRAQQPFVLSTPADEESASTSVSVGAVSDLGRGTLHIGAAQCREP